MGCQSIHWNADMALSVIGIEIRAPFTIAICLSFVDGLKEPILDSDSNPDAAAGIR